jgi:hypothetical protein
MVCLLMIMTALNKLNQLSKPERRLLYRSVLFLPIIDLGLRLMGYASLRRKLEKLPISDCIGRFVTESEALKQAKGVGRIVNIAAAHGLYKAGCLRKALLVWWLIHREGIQSEICFGVKKIDGHMEAHAWVEYRGTIVNDSEKVREQYQVLQGKVSSVKLGL